MLKTKGKVVSLLTACLTAIFALVLGFAALFAPTPITTANAETLTYTDTLDRSTTGATDSSYITWSGKELNSGVVYAGQSAGGNTAIQLRSDNNNSGIVTTASVDGIRVAKITVTWQSATSNGRTLNVYGKNTAYTQATDLYNSSNQGTLLGTIVKGTSTELTITGDYAYIGLRSASKAMYLSKIEIVWEKENTNDCEHVYALTPTDPYDGTHIFTCTECGEVKEGATATACENLAPGDWTTVDGTHSKTVTCNDCSGVQTESGTCEINAKYTRENNQHTQTGTCTVCGDSTSVTADCTPGENTYTLLTTNDKDAQKHSVTNTCEVCELQETYEEACSFNEELNGTVATYTCEYCGYSYTEEVETWTVSFSVPADVTAVESKTVVQGETITLPTADNYADYTFVGWVETVLTEKQETSPEHFEAGTDEYTPSADVTLYALYSYAEGTGAWTIVKDASTLAVGAEIVIVASDYNYALSTTQNSNNRGSVAVTKDGDTVTINDSVQVITVEQSTVDGQFAFYVEGDNTGYLYAASTSSNHLKTGTKNGGNASWSVEIDSAGVATVKANQNTRNWLRFNNANNPKLFSCYTSGQTDVSIYMKDGATYYVTEFNTCAHENTNEVIEPATCTESGSRTVTCLDCEAEIEAEILPALGHNYVDDICQNCDKVDPASIVYNGSYYLGLNGKYSGEKAGNYYKLFDFTPGETIESNYVFRFVKNGDTYDMYYADSIIKGITIETQEDYTVRIYNAEGKILSHNTTYTDYQRMGFYATSSNYPSAITLTEVASIFSASLSLGESLAMNYYVTTTANLDEAVMSFTFNERTYDVKGEKQSDGKYKFTLNEIAPQYMTENIKADLYLDNNKTTLLASKDGYSVQTYAQNKLNANPSKELKQLLTDLLYYGAAAQKHQNSEITNGALATNVANIGTPSTATPNNSAFSLVTNESPNSYPAYFTGANIWFDTVNKITAKFALTDDADASLVTATVNGVAAEIIDNRIYSNGILATDFDTVYTIVLSYDGVVMQTLTYSVNSYAYSMKDNATVGELALALYRYGVSAKAYVDALANA